MCIRLCSSTALLLITLLHGGLANCQVNGWFSPPNQQQLVSSREIAALQERADLGEARAQWMLGNAYREGAGVQQDYAAAARWYASAAAQNLPEAQMVLGYLYEHGKGVKKSDPEAFRYYQAAAQRGNPMAQNNLAAMYEDGRGTHKNSAEALHWYLLSSQAGNALAQCNLAAMYFFMQPDHRQSARWFRAAAEQGVVEAENSIGMMYYNGDGVSKDYNEAVNWDRRAAEAGYPLAQENLAYMLEQGKGVPLDYVSAYAWYSMAAAKGRHQSAERMKSLAKVMLPEQVRLAQSRVLLWKTKPGATGTLGERSSDSVSVLPTK